METRKVIYFLLALFFITSLVIPVAFFNKIFFVAILTIMLAKSRAESAVYTLSPIIIIFIFIYGFILSFLHVADRALSIQLLLAVLVLFLIYPVVRYSIDLDRICRISGIVLVIFTGMYLLVVTFGDVLFFKDIFIKIFDKYSSASFGARDLGNDDTWFLHLGTVPFLYLSFSLYAQSFFEKKTFMKVLAMIILFMAILGSASRGLIFTTLMIFIVLLFINLNVKQRVLLIMVSIPVISFGFYYLITKTLVFSSSEDSNSTKIGHFISFVDNLRFDNFLTGDGLATYYFSQGAHAFKAETEITPMDMFRYFGFILAPFLYLAVVFPTMRLDKYLGRNLPYTLIFLFYLIFSFTNPIMFNSFGLLVVLWYWSKVLNYKIPSVTHVQFNNAS